MNRKNEPFLRKIDVCFAEVQDVLEGAEEKLSATKHIEESSKCCEAFLNHCNCIYNAMIVKPFSLNTSFQKLNNSEVFPKKSKSRLHKTV